MNLRQLGERVDVLRNSLPPETEVIAMHVLDGEEHEVSRLEPSKDDEFEGLVIYIDD